MELNLYLKQQGVGAQSRLAKTLGVTQVDVSNWANLKRPVPLHQAVKIETATDGAVTRQDLRPDDWQEIWPELRNQAA